MTTVLCGVSQCVERLRTEFPEVDVVDLATYEGPIPPDAILFSGFDQKSIDAAISGVAWIQLAGTGIDHVNPALLQAPIVTCAKGAGAVPISEYSNTPSENPGVQLVGRIEEMLPDVDHLVLCVPATSTTVNILNEETLALAKPGLHLVNIARGSLIDQDALRVALDDGRIARASLDVCVPEPLPAGHWLYSHEKVLLTPHASWTGIPFLTGAMELFVSNLRRYLRGEQLVGVVDLELGY